VIMMSQNRQALRDRTAAEHDYVVNLRAELEIMHLHDKLDALRQAELADLLRRQNEMLEEMRGNLHNQELKPVRRGAKPAAADRTPE